MVVLVVGRRACPSIAACCSTFNAFVYSIGGRIVVVQPSRQIVSRMLPASRPGSRRGTAGAPGRQGSSARRGRVRARTRRGPRRREPLRSPGRPASPFGDVRSGSQPQQDALAVVSRRGSRLADMVEIAIRPRGSYSLALSARLAGDATRQVRDGLFTARCCGAIAARGSRGTARSPSDRRRRAGSREDAVDAGGRRRPLGVPPAVSQRPPARSRRNAAPGLRPIRDGPRSPGAPARGLRAAHPGEDG